MVSSDASVDWLCMPNFDSPSLCARLLDEQKGGYFKIEGINTLNIVQSYVKHTPILKTRVETTDGIFDIYDFMPRFVKDNQHYYCPSEIQRNIRVISGKPRVKIQVHLRPNYGSSDVETIQDQEYIKFISKSGEYHSFYLYTDLDFKNIIGQDEFELPASSYLVLSYHQKIRPFNADRNYVEFELTKSYWLAWVHRTTVPAAHREMVIRAMITLKLLMNHRTGAVIAAPTTSLPEIIGKERNWDYRYCWTRDASMIIELFSRLGHFNASAQYMDFILERILSKHENIAVMYSIYGEKILDEKILPHLSGYKNSKPVRVGNEAYRQVQNDVYGELLDAIYTYFTINHKAGFQFDQELWTVVRSLVNNASEVWKNPDNGIWEYRGEAQHHVFSKLMNWVAMDRAGRIAKIIGKEKYSNDCFQKAAEIKDNILQNGWNEEKNSFTMYYGSSQADAAVLLMLHYGFLEPDDQRMVKTVDYCYQELLKEGFIMRYTRDDDFGKPENAFILCSFWMVNALHLIGRKNEARILFDRTLTTANKLGLFSEGFDPVNLCQTGNFPQGYSHMAFIQSVLLLETDYSWGLPEL